MAEMAGRILALLLTGGAASLATAATAQEVTVPPPASDEGVTFSLTPYLWLTSIKGTVAATPASATPAAGVSREVDASFLDIAPHLKAALMVKSEIGFDRWGIVGDLAFASISIDAKPKVAGANIASATVDLKSLQSTVGVRYRFVDDPGLQLDAIAGARISYASVGVELNLLNRSVSGDRSQTWVDPVIGVRGRAQISRGWSLAGYGDVGGFGVSSKFTGQAMAAAAYHAPDSHWDFTFGYRYYKVDYSNLPLRLDLAMYGPLAGATYRF